MDTKPLKFVWTVNCQVTRPEGSAFRTLTFTPFPAEGLTGVEAQIAEAICGIAKRHRPSVTSGLYAELRIAGDFKIPPAYLANYMCLVFDEVVGTVVNASEKLPGKDYTIYSHRATLGDLYDLLKATHDASASKLLG